MEKKPGWLMNNEEGSFAESTILQRKPQILNRLIAENGYPDAICSGLIHFRDEIAGRCVKELAEGFRDSETWNQQLAGYGSVTWLDLPWYFAESYFYRRLLEITGYYKEDSSFYQQDPFSLQKQAQIEKDLASLRETDWLFSTRTVGEQFEGLLHAALWGNRADLSNEHVTFAHTSDEYHGADHLVELIDDTQVVKTFLENNHRTILYFLDNVGRELFSDLALIHWLLQHGWVEQVTVVAKPAPFFVSDALVSDVVQSMDALEKSGIQKTKAMVAELRKFLSEGKLGLVEHEWMCSSLMFSEMGAEFHAWLAAFDLAIFKGDANYRRVVEDRHWPYSTDIKTAAGYFQTDVVLIRTLKSELIVGLAEGVAEQLNETSHDWLIRGDYGLIQFIKKQEAVR